MPIRFCLLCLDTFEDGRTDTLASWERDDRVLTLTNYENVGDTSGELVADGILHVDDIMTTILLFNALDDTNTADVTTSSNHGNVALGKFDEVFWFVSLEVELDCVVETDIWVAVADSPSVVCDSKWDTLITDLPFVNTEELIFCLTVVDVVDNKTSLGVVEKPELLVGLSEFNDVHETGWITFCCTNLAINLDKPPLDDGGGFVGVEGVLQPVTEEDDEWKAFTELVWTCSWVSGEFTSSLSKHPMVWSCKPFKMFPLATWHRKGWPQPLSFKSRSKIPVQ